MKLPQTLKAIFFDVDNTLFDHHRAQRAALHQILTEFQHALSHIAAEEMISLYEQHNAQSWNDAVKKGMSWQEQWVRPFKSTFEQLQIGEIDVDGLANRYSLIYANQPYPCPNALECVERLRGRYRLGILSNGFANVQRAKLQTLGMDALFEHLVFSADVGTAKPGLAIFEAATRLASCRPEEIMYVGDSIEHDVQGARAAGWISVYLNRTSDRPAPPYADYEIDDLLQLTEESQPREFA